MENETFWSYYGVSDPFLHGICELVTQEATRLNYECGITELEHAKRLAEQAIFEVVRMQVQGPKWINLVAGKKE
jgi:hypothetical protein